MTITDALQLVPEYTLLRPGKSVIENGDQVYSEDKIIQQ